MCIFCGRHEKVKRCMSCLAKMNSRLKLYCMVEATKPLSYGRPHLLLENKMLDVDYDNSVASWIEHTIHMFDTEITSVGRTNDKVGWEVIDTIMKGRRAT